MAWLCRLSLLTLSEFGLYVDAFDDGGREEAGVSGR